MLQRIIVFVASLITLGLVLSTKPWNAAETNLFWYAASAAICTLLIFFIIWSAGLLK